jgi:hypothetical protein
MFVQLNCIVLVPWAPLYLTIAYRCGFHNNYGALGVEILSIHCNKFMKIYTNRHVERKDVFSSNVLSVLSLI